MEYHKRMCLYAPYVFLAKKEEDNEYHLCVIIPVLEGEDITSFQFVPGDINTVDEMSYEITGIPTSKKVYFARNYQVVLNGHPEKISLESKTQYVSFSSRMLYQDSYIGDFTMEDDLVLGAPYAYLSNPHAVGSASDWVMFPYVILVAKNILIQSLNNSSIDHHCIYQIETAPSSFPSSDITFENDIISLNGRVYEDTSRGSLPTEDGYGFFEIEIVPPEDPLLKRVDKNKKVKIRNKNSDTKPNRL